MELEISPLEEFIIETESSFGLDDDTKELHKALLEEDGHSLDEKYLPLVKEGLAYVFSYKKERHIVLNNTPIRIFMFRIPTFRPDVDKSPLDLAMFIQYKNIIARWFMFAEKEEDLGLTLSTDEYKQLFARFMSEFHFISCPQFMVQTLLDDFEPTKNCQEFEEITVNVKEIQCPNCDVQFSVLESRKDYECPCCGNSFTY